MLTVLPAVAVTVASGGTAAARPALAPPVIENVISLPGVVSVKFHNPNSEGVCWIYREDTGEFFGGNNPTSFAVPGGKMVQSSTGPHDIPAGRVPVRGACAWKRPATTNDWVSRTNVIMVDVAGKPGTGSF